MENTLYNQAKTATEEVISLGKLTDGDVLVVGCSSSEVCGDKIGTESNEDVAAQVFSGIYDAVREHGVYLAAQCCEHLNTIINTLNKYLFKIYIIFIKFEFKENIFR